MLKSATWILPARSGKLVDREDAAIGAWQQTVVNRQLIAQQVTAFGGFDRIDVTDDVRNGDVGSRKLFDKARVATDPVERHRIAVLRQHLSPVSGDWPERIVVDFRAGDDRDALVEQIGEQADDAALCLSAQPEQDDVMPRENRIDQLRDNGVLVTDNARKEFLAGAQFFD